MSDIPALRTHLWCQVCEKKFFASSCGTGYTWDLYSCEHCGAFYAMPTGAGYVPQEVIKDPNVICLKTRPNFV